MEKYADSKYKSDNDEEKKDDNIDWEEYDKLADESEKNVSKKELIYQSRTLETCKLRNEILKKNSSAGVCGLNNLGNTCFMNSAIQCLSNTEDLTYYFLSGKFKNDINTSNKHGLKGKLANAWNDLLEELWLSSKRKTSPSDLKYTISRIASQFTGYSQHDSQELLTFLIDGIHEDLNRITDKPYREVQEKQKNETDDDAAFRFWQLHRDRNDSILVDLFNGQFKSTITCPECHRVSTTFDPFTTLSLPIPKLKKVDLFYVPKNNLRKTTRLSIFISEDALFFDIHDYIQQHLDTKMGKFRCILVANDECLKILNLGENILKSLDKGFIFCCEINEKVQNHVQIPIHIVNTVQSGKNQFKTYPRLITVGEKMVVSDLKLMLYAFARRFFIIPENLRQNFGQKATDLIKDFTENAKDFEDKDYYDLVKEEYYMLFEPHKIVDNSKNNQSFSYLTEDERKQLIESFPVKFYFVDKRSNEKTVILDNKFYFDYNFSKNNAAASGDSEQMSLDKQITEKLEKLSIENNDQTNDKKFSYNFNNDTTLEGYLQLLKTNDLYLIFELNFDILDSTLKKALTACRSIAVQEKTKMLNLNDCFNHFKLTEKLDKNNEWYCSECKKHQKAFKKLELYYIPKNLILHLKRFEYTGSSRYRTYAEKLGNLVDFPLDNLNLKNFVIGPHNNANTTYELYAVSQHFGSVGGGHYTACCKNNNQWYDFNDSSVSGTNENNVVSSSAYMLFYRRKD